MKLLVNGDLTCYMKFHQSYSITFHPTKGLLKISREAGQRCCDVSSILKCAEMPCFVKMSQLARGLKALARAHSQRLALSEVGFEPTPPGETAT